MLQATFPILDRRLRPASDASLAVAFSGGGDSLALLLITRAWAEAHGRRVIALTVDHGLNPDSAGWTQDCRETAARLEVGFRALHWTGDKPATGLPAAAREARHALLAEAARDVGAKVLLLGHTADDLTESAAMRAEGSTVSDPREWSPSPAWPEGRDVFLLRPLLGVKREALRDRLREAGETWIDDPANEDQRFARARARSSSPFPLEGGRAGDGGGGLSATRPAGVRAPSDAMVAELAPPSTPALPPSRGKGAIFDAGVLTLPRSTSPGVLAMAALCAAGTSRTPRGDNLDFLLRRLRDGEPFVTTLGGARIEVDWHEIRVMREAGEISRGGLAATPLEAGRITVWDGRFEVLAERPGFSVQALSGRASRLPEAEQRRLKTLAPAARPPLPATIGPDGSVSCPILAEHPSVRVRALALARFEAALGRVDREPAP